MPQHLEPIAVVGMACRFPGAPDVEQFWRNLLAGKETISFFTPEQLRAAGVSEERIANRDYVPAAPMMPDSDLFDAGLFGMTAREAEICDPQLRAFLEVCHSAAEHAGYDPFALPDSVGVFGTVGPNSYLPHHIRKAKDRINSLNSTVVATLNQADYLATTVSYKLNLRGPSMTVLTACSSALAAVHVACQSLRYGECDSALAGGAVVDTPLGRGHLWTPGSVYTSDGHCRPFSASATGTIFGSGTGVVLLKRLDDALAAGDAIHAVIRASALNNDGSDKVSFSAPSVSGQSAAVMEAMALADVEPEQIGYIEAHATGTLLGDPIEIAALTEAYTALAESPLPIGGVPIGSVKSNIGHLNEAAGIAGLIKAVLALEREAIPATIGVDTVNPRLGIESTPFAVNTDLRPWPREAGKPRFAGVTSLGIGGSNVHAVLAEAPLTEHEPANGRPRIVVWSARTEAARDQARTQVAEYFDRIGEDLFADATATLQHGRTPHPVRGAAVCSSARDAAEALSGKVLTGTAEPGTGVGWLFPGQGAHRPRMAVGLYGVVRPFTIAMDECLDAFEREGVPLCNHWLADDPEPAAFADPLVVQPLLFSVEYALSRMWLAWGPAPAAVLGHSVGELTAATAAGVFDVADAVRLVTARATAMRDNPAVGGMLAVAAEESTVRELLPEHLAIAAINGARQTVVSGPDGALTEFATRLTETGIGSKALPVSHAFHHPEWTAAVAAFGKAFDSVTLHTPTIPLYSGLTGARLTDEQAVDPGFWTEQLTAPVRFAAAADALLADGHRVLVEVGPGRTLSQLLRHTTDAPLVISTLPDRTDDHHAALTAAARLWIAGRPIDWAATGQPAPRTRVALPGYPYERARHWIEAPSEGAPAQAPQPARKPEITETAVPEPSTAPTSDLPLSAITWVQQQRPASNGRAHGTALVLLPAEDEHARPVLRAVQRAGFRVIRVRPGTSYSAGPGEFQIRPDQPGDVERVLAETGTEPDVFVHALTAAPWPRPDQESLPAQLGAAYFSLHALAKAAVLRPAATAPRVVAITSGSVDVTGAERIDPVKATVHGLVRTLLSEAPHLAGGVIDIGERVSVADLAEELALPLRAEVVALRRRHRWVPVEAPLPLPATLREPVRDGGVYLITGGFGGLGLALAQGLAETGLCPKLILLGRNDPAHGTSTGERAERVGAAVAELVALGAEVRTAACDVTDPAALRAVVAAAVAEFGPVNGVFHLAGVAGGRMIAFREQADALAVLAPKVAGTLAVEQVFADAPPLDFVVHFSSRSAADGLVGGADYAAANAFLDAMSGESELADGRVLSVDWPVWSGVGMAEESDVDIAGLARTVARLSKGAPARKAEPAPAGEVVREVELGAATDWVLDEHRVNRIPLLPGTAYLDLLVRTFREDVTPAEPGAVVLEDVVFRAPFYDQKPRTLRLAFRAAGEGHEFTAASRPVGDDAAPWVTHVTGRATRTGQPPASVDVESIRTRLVAAGAKPTKAQGRTAFILGPRWQNLTDQWIVGEEKLVRVALSPAFHDDLGRHALHPALLDTVTAAVRTAEQRSTVPFLYRRLVAYRDLPATFLAHVRRRDSAGTDTAAGDLDLVTEDGAVLATVEGFTMRQVDLSTVWEQAPEPVAEPEPVPVAAEGLDPERGVRLLLDMLAARLAGTVLVRPFANGRPQPLRQQLGVSLPTIDQPVVRPAPVPAPTVVEPEPVVTAAVAAPSTTDDLPGRVRRLWMDALGVDEVEEGHDFFEAGGNSLTAIDIMAHVREMFGIELSIGLLLEARTFGELVSVLRANGAA